MSAAIEVDKPNKAMGPDRLHPWVLKETARAVAPILQIIFSKSTKRKAVIGYKLNHRIYGTNTLA